MAFFSKDLSELVARVEERKQKITNMIATLEAQAMDLKNEIEAQNSLLVESELANDEPGKKAAEKEIRKLKQKLEDLQDKIMAYQKESQKPSAKPKEIEKIREAAIKEQDLKRQKVEKLAADKKSIEQQIKVLQIQLEEVQFEYNQAHNDESVEREVRKIITSIEPRLKDLKGFHREDALKVFMRDWISGTNVNEHIYFPKEWTEEPVVIKPEFYSSDLNVQIEQAKRQQGARVQL